MRFHCLSIQSSLSSSQFSQPGFGSQSSGGSFSSQGGSVLSSGFGFGGASCPGKEYSKCSN